MRVAVAVAVAIGLAPQLEPAPPPPPETSVVHVRAVVADGSGRAVGDLEARDFELLEEGSPRPLDSVRFVTATGTAVPGEALPDIHSSADEQVEAEREGARLFAFFLDEYHVTSGAPAARVRETLNGFIEQQLGPRDLAVVLRPLDSLLNIRLTRDRQSVAATIAAFEGRKGEYAARNPFEETLFAGSPERVEGTRAQIAVSALNALATHLGGLSSTRKSIVVVSEGFGIGTHRRGEVLPTLESVIRTAQRAAVSIYPIDPRALIHDGTADQSLALAPGDSAVSRDREMLRSLATGTDGSAILAAADLDSGLRRIISDLSGYYLLAFRAPVSGPTATYRAVQVRVTRPGVNVKAAAGYWSPRADLSARDSVPRPRPVLAARRTSPLIRPWFGISRADAGRSRVRFVWEPAPGVPGNRTRAPEAVQLKLNVSTPEGAPVFEGMVRRSGVQPDGNAAQAREAVFDVPPGRVRVVMQIEDETSRLVDTDVRDVIVGALNGPVAMATAEVLRARTAREFRVLAADPDALPVASRVFSRDERLLIRVRAYGADSAPVLSATLASELGGRMRAVPVEPGPTPDVYQVDLSLAGLAPGEYRIEVTAAAGRSRATETVAFRITT